MGKAPRDASVEHYIRVRLTLLGRMHVGTSKRLTLQISQNISTVSLFKKRYIMLLENIYPSFQIQTKNLCFDIMLNRHLYQKLKSIENDTTMFFPAFASKLK